jgi:hypothetical protein
MKRHKANNKEILMKTTTNNEALQTKMLFAIIALVVALAAILTLQSCSSDGDDKNDNKNSAVDIAHCKDTVGAIDECFGAESVLGMDAAAATKECESGEKFDDYDHCFFNCEDKAMNCDEFADCLDNC